MFLFSINSKMTIFRQCIKFSDSRPVILCARLKGLNRDNKRRIRGRTPIKVDRDKKYRVVWRGLGIDSHPRYEIARFGPNKWGRGRSTSLGRQSWVTSEPELYGQGDLTFSLSRFSIGPGSFGMHLLTAPPHAWFCPSAVQTWNGSSNTNLAFKSLAQFFKI